jgi:hypothetical protein
MTIKPSKELNEIANYFDKDSEYMGIILKEFYLNQELTEPEDCGLFVDLLDEEILTDMSANLIIQMFNRNPEADEPYIVMQMLEYIEII